MDKIFLALDIGTTNVKRRDPRTFMVCLNPWSVLNLDPGSSFLYTANGNQLFSTSRRIEIIKPERGASEINPDDLWENIGMGSKV